MGRRTRWPTYDGWLQRFIPAPAGFSCHARRSSNFTTVPADFSWSKWSAHQLIILTPLVPAFATRMSPPRVIAFDMCKLAFNRVG